jgi:hypothetical protein
VSLSLSKGAFVGIDKLRPEPVEGRRAEPVEGLSPHDRVQSLSIFLPSLASTYHLAPN